MVGDAPGIVHNTWPAWGDALLLDLLCEWAPDADTRQRILVDNPQALYGFAATA